MNDRVKEFANAIDEIIERFGDLKSYESVGILHIAAASIEAAANDGNVTVIVACAEKEMHPIWEGLSKTIQ